MTTLTTLRTRICMPLLACLLGIGVATPEAKASIVLEYTGNPLTNSGVNCSLQTCLTGSITVEFHVLASAIPASSPFCLALETLGTTSNDCLAVEFAIVKNDLNTLLIEGDPNNLATLDLNPNSPSWLVSLVGFSNLDPVGSQLLLMNSATGDRSSFSTDRPWAATTAPEPGPRRILRVRMCPNRQAWSPSRRGSDGSPWSRGSALHLAKEDCRNGFEVAQTLKPPEMAGGDVRKHWLPLRSRLCRKGMCKARDDAGQITRRFDSSRGTGGVLACCTDCDPLTWDLRFLPEIRDLPPEVKVSSRNRRAYYASSNNRPRHGVDQ